jgi:hypothetical protein
LLTNPATLKEGDDYGSPTLIKVLKCYQQEIAECYRIHRIVIPLGITIRSRMFFINFQHFVTLSIDFIYTNNQLNINIIDSLGNYFTSILRYKKNLEIYNIINKLFADNGFVVGLKKQYLNQQSITDNVSCGFFTLKIIKELIEEPEDTINIVEQSIGGKPLLWMASSQQWLSQESCCLIYNQSKKYLAEYGSGDCILQSRTQHSNKLKQD